MALFTLALSFDALISCNFLEPTNSQLFLVTLGIVSTTVAIVWLPFICFNPFVVQFFFLSCSSRQNDTLLVIVFVGRFLGFECLLLVLWKIATTFSECDSRLGHLFFGLHNQNREFCDSANTFHLVATKIITDIIWQQRQGSFEARNYRKLSFPLVSFWCWNEKLTRFNLNSWCFHLNRNFDRSFFSVGKQSKTSTGILQLLAITQFSAHQKWIYCFRQVGTSY